MNCRDYLAHLLSFCSSDAEQDADRICNSFDRFVDVANTDKHFLQKTSGCSEKTADFLRLVTAITSRRITEHFKKGKKCSQKEINDYIIALSLGHSMENIYLILFDEKERFIDTVHISEGSVNRTGFIPRKMLDIAVIKKAKTAILTHNHPSGLPKPSEADLNSTMVLRSILRDMDITLKAHYIVAGFNTFDCLPIANEGMEEMFRDDDDRLM